MKTVKDYTLYGKRNIYEFLANHVDETIRVKKVSDNAMVFAIEHEMTEAEMHMQVLRTQLECDEYLTEEEKAAIEYSIDCIKTLKDMGVIK